MVSSDNPGELTVQQINQARERCTRFISGHGLQDPAQLLAMIPAQVKADRYGDGGVVSELEQEVAGLLGKAAALFLPTGTMAQQATLRVHADRRSRRTVVFHPTCHLDWHEGRGYQRLHGLFGVPVGNPSTPLATEELRKIAEPPAALLIELPQREIGGVLPEWEELEAQVAWARERGAAVHMDGARLWESAPYYGRPLGQIAALFDTVYVSFYKGLGAIAGCCVAGSEDVIAEVSEWRTRHGGRVFGLWPYAAAALTALRTRLPRMNAYYKHAQAIAKSLSGLPGVTVLPDPPQTPMMHLQLQTTPAELQQRALELVEREKLWTFPRPFALDSPEVLRVELSVGDATLELSPTDVRQVIEQLVRRG